MITLWEGRIYDYSLGRQGYVMPLLVGRIYDYSLGRTDIYHYSLGRKDI